MLHCFLLTIFWVYDNDIIPSVSFRNVKWIVFLQILELFVAFWSCMHCAILALASLTDFLGENFEVGSTGVISSKW